MSEPKITGLASDRFVEKIAQCFPGTFISETFLSWTIFLTNFSNVLESYFANSGLCNLLNTSYFLPKNDSSASTNKGRIGSKSTSFKIAIVEIAPTEVPTKRSKWSLRFIPCSTLSLWTK